jgi:hypothetical protein
VLSPGSVVRPRRWIAFSRPCCSPTSWGRPSETSARSSKDTVVTELAEAGYVVKQKHGRRNRYRIEAHLPLPEPARRERTVGEVLALLADTDARLQLL